MSVGVRGQSLFVHEAVEVGAKEHAPAANREGFDLVRLDQIVNPGAAKAGVLHGSPDSEGIGLRGRVSHDEIPRMLRNADRPTEHAGISGDTQR